MRKPIAAFGLAITASLGVIPAGGVLAATPTPTPRATASPTPGSTQQASTVQSNNVSPGAIIQTALKYLGYEYTTVGNSPATGFSCIGFVSYVYRANGIPLPGDLQDAWNYAPRVPFSDLQPGDILYFKNTVWTGLSHVAIYLGGGKFVHSEYYGVGVRVSSFYNDPKDYNYWTQKYMGANRPWGGAPVSASTVPLSAWPNKGAAATVTATNTGKVGSTATITVAVNVRTSPAVTAQKQTVLNAGQQVKVLGKSNGWYRVQLPDGSTGWIIADGLGLGTTSTAVPTATVSSSSSSTAANGRNGVNNNTVGTPTAPARQGQVATTGKTVTVKAQAVGLRVHSGPSTSAGTLTSVSPGQHLTVIARSGKWIQVQLPDGTVGWVSAAYVSSSSSAKASTTSTTSATTTVKATKTAATHMVTAGVRVHTGANIKSRVITTIAAGTHVTVLGYTKGWAHLLLPSGQIGYVLGTYVR